MALPSVGFYKQRDLVHGANPSYLILTPAPPSLLYDSVVQISDDFITRSPPFSLSRYFISVYSQCFNRQ